MKKPLAIAFVLITLFAQAQTASDLFSSGTPVTWLGVDYSHVKLIGDFSQFKDAGGKNVSEIKNTYFPAWNDIVVKEREKYNLKAMLRKEDITYDIDMITKVNDEARLDELEDENTPNYTKEDIQKFVSTYKPENTEGLGLVFIAETLNKNAEEAYFHVVVLNLKTREVLIQERLKGKPGGFGLRNFWARPILEVIELVTKKYYKSWKATYAK